MDIRRGRCGLERHGHTHPGKCRRSKTVTTGRRWIEWSERSRVHELQQARRQPQGPKRQATGHACRPRHSGTREVTHIHIGRPHTHTPNTHTHARTHTHTHMQATGRPLQATGRPLQATGRGTRYGGTHRVEGHDVDHCHWQFIFALLSVAPIGPLHSICLPICLSVFLSVCLSASLCLFTRSQQLRLLRV